MTIPENLLKAINANVSPDCWNGKWSQANQFGGGQAIELEVGELMHGLVRALKPQVVIETGTHQGFSGLMIASALRANGSGKLYTIDIQDHGPTQNFTRFGFNDLVTFIQNDSAAGIRGLIGKVESVDLLWLDADHSTASVSGELEAAKPLLKTGSYIAFHDTIIDPREAKAVDEVLKANPTWEHVHFVTARGFELLRVL